MKHTAVALTLATFLLAGTPVLAKPTPSAPPTYLPSVVTPYDAYAPLFLAPMPEPRKHTGASNPDTPDPTRNTGGGEELIFQTRSPVRGHRASKFSSTGAAGRLVWGTGGKSPPRLSSTKLR